MTDNRNAKKDAKRCKSTTNKHKNCQTITKETQQKDMIWKRYERQQKDAKRQRDTNYHREMNSRDVRLKRRDTKFRCLVCCLAPIKKGFYMHLCPESHCFITCQLREYAWCLLLPLGGAQNPYLSKEKQSPLLVDWVHLQVHLEVKHPGPQVRLGSKVKQEKMAPLPVDVV